MPESMIHAGLVLSLVDWVAREYLNGDYGCICHDMTGRPASSAPPRIAHYVPDVFANGGLSCPVVVGEAKTVLDLDTTHSHGQFEAFLSYCDGHTKAVFVLAVPWHAVPFARNMMRRICRRNQWNETTVIILELLAG